MNKELIEKIVDDFEGADYISTLDIRQILTKHLKDKVIIEKKVLEEIIEKQDLVIGEKNLYNTLAWSFYLQLQSLLANQE